MLRSALRPVSPHLRYNPTLQRFSTSTSSRASYEDTIPNLRLTDETRVIFQGFTGRVSTFNAKQSLEWGTKIVGGTTPGKEGEHLGLPLLPSVREAAEKLKPDATGVFVAAHQAGKAIEDAIEAEIPLIVAVAEFIPLHDVLRIAAMLKTQTKSRLVGANAPGIISPLHKCRIGFQPLPCYKPGKIGMIAKSGTLSYEAVGALSRADMGQSLCIGMGGDIVAGTNIVDGLSVFENDPDTEAIVIIGEIGGRAEQDAAQWIYEYRKRTSNPKPMVAAVAGLQAPFGRIMGHAGAFQLPAEDSAETKYKALQNAGVRMVSHPTHFPAALNEVLKEAGKDPSTIVNFTKQEQTRGYHTATRISPSSLAAQRSRPSPFSRTPLRPTIAKSQTRKLNLTSEQSKKLLQDEGVPVAAKERKEVDKRYLAITVDRTNRCPGILASPTAYPGKVYHRAKLFPYDYNTGPDDATIKAAFEHLHMDAAPPAAMAQLKKIITVLAKMFKEKEAYSLAVDLSGTDDGNLQVEAATFGFDDSAPKSAKRQQELHGMRDLSLADPVEVEAEKDGIVYVKFEDPSAYLGILINGAGLSMNAVDALIGIGAKPTNFLDTGGKATSETIKKCFELMLKDDRTKVIFVNIFGGLTLCDMIAEGITLAFKELKMSVPVVVRLRGTNEEKGQKMIQESGLPLHAFDDFTEAANKCIELSRQ